MASKPGRDTLLVSSTHGRTSVPPFCKSKDRAALPPELVDIMHIDFRGRRTAVEAEVEYRSKLVPHYKGVIILVGGNDVANLSCCADGNIANHVLNPVKKELAKIAQSLLSLIELDWICLTTTHVLQDILAVLHKWMCLGIAFIL